MNNNGVLDWDSYIENDGNVFVELPEDDYVFTVANMERGHFEGSSKMDACPKATLTLKVEAPDGTANVFVDLFLHQNFEWKIAAFFRCIGAKKQGERMKPDWAHVVGKKGIGHFKSEKYIGRDGTQKTRNVLVNFKDYKPIYTEVQDDNDLPF